MEIPVIYIFTHDSIGVGEDGPTHQPVEQLASLRAIPGLITLRPADANEVVEAWRVIMQLRHEPVALILTRQALPTLDRTKIRLRGGRAARARTFSRMPTTASPTCCCSPPAVKSSLCIEAYEQLKAEGIKARVVSMPSWELFEHYCREHPEYREQVLPDVGDRARLGGTGVHARLGALRRPARPQHRHGDLRRVGAAEGTAEEIRLRPRERRRRRPGSRSPGRGGEPCAWPSARIMPASS